MKPLLWGHWPVDDFDAFISRAQIVCVLLQLIEDDPRGHRQAVLTKTQISKTCLPLKTSTQYKNGEHDQWQAVMRNVM